MYECEPNHPPNGSGWHFFYKHGKGGDQINVHRRQVRVERLRAYLTYRGRKACMLYHNRTEYVGGHGEGTERAPQG